MKNFNKSIIVLFTALLTTSYSSVNASFWDKAVDNVQNTAKQATKDLPTVLESIAKDTLAHLGALLKTSIAKQEYPTDDALYACIFDSIDTQVKTNKILNNVVLFIGKQTVAKQVLEKIRKTIEDTYFKLLRQTKNAVKDAVAPVTDKIGDWINSGENNDTAISNQDKTVTDAATSPVEGTKEIEEELLAAYGS